MKFAVPAPCPQRTGRSVLARSWRVGASGQGATGVPASWWKAPGPSVPWPQPCLPAGRPWRRGWGVCGEPAAGAADTKCASCAFAVQSLTPLRSIFKSFCRSLGFAFPVPTGGAVPAGACPQRPVTLVRARWGHTGCGSSCSVWICELTTMLRWGERDPERSSCSLPGFYQDRYLFR